jgi:hypothetical protein
MTNTPKHGSAAASWVCNAATLAAWAMERLVNRDDAWGGYRLLNEVGKVFRRADGTTGTLGSQTTRPAPYRRGKEILTEKTLARHFCGFRREDLVGLHSTSPENTSRWGGIDLDHHGATSTPAETNWAAAQAWYVMLVSRGFQPLLTDSNGAGGFHLLAIFAEPVATPKVFAFLKSLTSDHNLHGMSKAPEVFPKQPRIHPGRYGNWLRLPGKHHTRAHWSRVWGGSNWLDGAQAVEFILTLTGDPADLVPNVPLPPPTRPRAAHTPYHPIPGDRLTRRIVAYMTRLPHLGVGQGRDAVAYHFAAWLARDLALGDEPALAWLERWDAGNRPPKGSAALAEILKNARQYGQNDVGCGLNSPPRDGHVILSERMEVWG